MLHIFTLTWNGKDKMVSLHQSLIPALCGIDYIWHIRDNNSNDDSLDFLNSIATEKIVIHQHNHNRDNFAQGMNYLFKTAEPNDTDYIMLLNNDVVFGDTKSIHNMLSVMNDPDVAVVGARILYPNSNRLQHGGVTFSKRYNYLPFHYHHNEISTAEDEKIRSTQAVTAAVAIFRAKEYKQIYQNSSGMSGMDERYFWCYEDIDACLTIKHVLKKKVMYCGNTLIFHEESASLKKNPVNKMMLQQNLQLFRNKWSGRYQLDD